MRLARESERVRIKRMNETPEEKAERRRREMEKKRIMRGMPPASGSTSTATSPQGATTTTIVIGPGGTGLFTCFLRMNVSTVHLASTCFCRIRQVVPSGPIATEVW